ncbi:MAG TPA: hypothetical protein VHZ78_08990 [Rhizomicrobium sp.]|jgi:hypothetical protein|nr:hypothetical protein [Rhizomicrobium sp.]
MAPVKTSYLYVQWKKPQLGEASHLYSELDRERYELRKVEIFNDGRRGFADANEEFGGTRLGETAVPTLEELAGDPDFDAKAITADEFQRQWLKRR